jgi:hypothetical protein
MEIGAGVGMIVGVKVGVVVGVGVFVHSVAVAVARKASICA